MKKKTPSSSPQKQNLDQALPNKAIASLSPNARAILELFLGAHCDLKSIFFSQAYIGRKIDRSRFTVIRALKELVVAGFITKQTRNYQSCLYFINQILLSPKWHKELYYWFRRYPAVIIPLAISLLFSPAVAKQGVCNTIISGPSGDLVSKRHTTEGAPSCPRGMPPQMPLVIKKESNNVKQIDPLKAKKVRGIALALNKRGAKLSNHEAVGLMAYDDAALDLASARMRDSKGLRNPAAFYLSLCKRHTQEMGCLPDWDMVRYMRDNAVRLLTPEEEIAALEVNVSDNAMRTGSQKRERHEQPYSEQVKQGQARERQAAELRKPVKLDRETEIAQCRKDLATLEAKKESGCPFAADSVKIVRKMLADLEATPVNHPLEPEAIRCSTADGKAVLGSWAPLTAPRLTETPKNYSGFIFDRDEE